jgi:dihydrofolate reductase
LHVFGSANLVQTLLKHDLVDALWLKTFPITLGGGKRLFADGTIPAAFKVAESTVTSKASLSSITSAQAQSQPEVYKHSRRSRPLFDNSR